MKRGSKVFKKEEKTGPRSKAVPSPVKIKINILVSSAAVSTAGASTGTSSAPHVHNVKVDDDGALITSLRSLPVQNGASNS